VLTALLSTFTAAFFGGSDFLGGFASKRSPALIVTTVVYAVGVVVFTAALFVVRPSLVTQGDIAWALAAGVAGTIGVLALYAALATGRMGIIAPVTAAIAGAGPAVFDLARGVHVGPLRLVGLALALVAVIVVSTIADVEDEHGTPPLALVLAVTAGLGFSASLICLSFTGHESAFAPLLVSRISGLAILLVAVLGRRVHREFADTTMLKLALGAGALDAAANITMLTAVRIGPMAVASVVGALYPVGTILLARTVLHERLHRQQVVGVVIALVAVVLTALP
jgi:drug/metabolite transporter (DMT)-like permease